MICIKADIPDEICKINDELKDRFRPEFLSS